MGIPGVKTHAARFVLGRPLGKPKRLQRKGNHARKILRGAFVVVVGIADLQTVNTRFELACVFDTDQVAEFVRDYVRKPTVAAADFEVPVG